MRNHLSRERKTTLHGSILSMVAIIALALCPAVAQDKKTSSAPPPKPAQAPPRTAPPAARSAPPKATTPQTAPSTGRTATPTHPNASRNITPNIPANEHPAGLPNPRPTAVSPNIRGAATHSNLPSRVPAGKTVSLKSGGTANLRPNGKIRSIDRGGVHIQYGIHGDRKIVSEHNGARIVTTGSHRGYVQRPYVVRNGHTYVQRTYVVNHVAHTVTYRSYYYGGTYYYGYRPAFYYHPVFYGWAYSPWPAPVYWSWGWTPAAYRWYGYYGYYFAPYPVYPSAAFWLTDYLIAANLEAAYAARADVASQDGGGSQDTQPIRQDDSARPPAQQTVALSPEVKQAIAEEVKAQIAAEQNAAGQNTPSGGGSTTAASGEVPPALDPARRTFVVSDSLDVMSDDQECALTPGDVITRLSDTPDQDQKVTVSVSTSKKADCAPGKQVAVSVEALQEMQNHFREQLDSGLKVLAQKQGTGNLPTAPDTGTIPGEVPAPPPDTTAAKALQDQQATADQIGSEVAREASGQGS